MAAYEGGIEREYRKRRKVPRGTSVALGLVAFNGIFHLTRAHHVMPQWVPAALAGLYVLLMGWMALHMWRGRTVVGPRGITTRRAMTERTRAWPDVYDIRAEPVPNAPAHQRHWLTYLYDT